MKKAIYVLSVFLVLLFVSNAWAPPPIPIVIGGKPINQITAPTNGQIPKYNSTTGKWEMATDSTGGTPTFDAIATGANTTATMTVGTGGTITYAGTGAINATKILNVTPVANALTLLGHDFTNMRSDLGLVIGTNVQAYSAYIDMTSSIQTQLNGKAPAANPTFTGLVTIPAYAAGTAGLVINTTAVQTTGAQLNYLDAATGTTGTTSQKLVFDTSPTLVTPTLGAALATSINGITLTSSAGSTVTITAGKTLTFEKTMDFKSAGDSTVATFPNSTGTVAYSGTLTNTNWCRTDGTSIICDQTAPTGSGTITKVGDIATGEAFSTGTPGKTLIFNNATSGTITLQAATGALGTGTVISLPGQNGTIQVSPTTTTVGQVFQGTTTAGLGAWSTATYPLTVTANRLLYAPNTNVISDLASGNSSVLVTNGSGVPSLATDIPTAVTIGSAYIYRAGGTDVPVTDGGTGVSTVTANSYLKGNGTSALVERTYSEVRTDLGLVIGTNVQAYDADLTTYAGITPSANIQSLLGSADYATARTNLGLAIGTNVQAYDAELAALAGLTFAQGGLIYGTGAGTVGTLAKDANATRYLSNTGTTNNPAWAQVNVTNGITGVVPVANLGTGTPDGTKFLRDDGTWVVPTGAGDVTSVGDCASGACNDETSDGGTYLGLYSASGAVRIRNNAGVMEARTAADAGYSAFTAAAITGTTASFGAGGFTVDADGDTVAKTVTMTKASGVAGDIGLYEANSTDTDAAGFRGPASLSSNTSYRGQFPNARATTDNSVLAWAGTAVSGAGTPTDPYLHAMSFIVPLQLSGGTMTGKLITATPATSPAGLNIPHGTEPSSLANGDIWTTTSGLYARINGSTVGPYISAGSLIDDTAYNATSWDGVTGVGPSKNAVRDYLETLAPSSIVAGAYGGTGVANTGKTITIGGNVTFSGAYATQFTIPGAYTYTFPATSDTLAGLAQSNTFTTQQNISFNSSTNLIKGLSSTPTITATTGITAYGTYQNTTSSAVVTTGTETLYGTYSNVTKSGADTTIGTIYSYGLFATSQNTGSTDAGNRSSYGGYFNATGDTAGTSFAYGIYATATGADTNYAGYFDGAVAVTGSQTVSKVNSAGGSANALTLSGTLGIFDGSDTFRGLYLNYINANHTGTGNTAALIDVPAITGDANSNFYGIRFGNFTGTTGAAGEVEEALNVGTGFDYGVYNLSPFYTGDGTNGVTITAGGVTTAAGTGSIEATTVKASTANALGIGTIELGHASDTTIARVGAGVVSVEGLSLPRIVASGAVTNDSGSISSGACTTAIDGGTATGVATTDKITWNFNGDPTGITGFAASATGGLFIYAYPTTDHVNYKICNNTAGAIDPGSITINWVVLR